MMFRAAVLVTVLPLLTYAQPNSVEVWGNVGPARVGGDEGSEGSGPIYGGGVAVPLSRRIAVEVDIARIRVDRFSPETHVFISPAIVWRWGSDRVYGFAGAGPGLVATSGLDYELVFPPGQAPESIARDATRYSATVHGRGGFVYSPTGKILFRAELFSAFRYVLPTVGVKFGMGYRF